MGSRRRLPGRPQRSGKAAVSAAVAVSVVAALGLFLLHRYQRMGRPRLHLLLITLDTTRADRLGCYGCDKRTSPNLDELARQSVVFDQAIAQAAVTPVSHASMFTGLDPHHHGLRVLHGRVANRLEEEQTTLAEIWKAAGGRTGAFVSAFPCTAEFGLDQGFSHFDAAFPNATGSKPVDEDGTVNTCAEQRLASETTPPAIQWLRDKARLGKPIFMWVHYFDPHDHLARPQYAELGPFVKEDPPKSHQLPDRLRAVYDWEVHFMDQYLGRLLDEFKRANLWDKTMVVVVADHGEGLGDHNWWAHGILYQEQIRVPLIIRAPGCKEGSRVKSLVRTTDILPTVLETVGIARPRWPKMDGLSLTGALKTGSMESDRTAYSDSVNLMIYCGRPLSDSVDPKEDKLYCLMRNGKKLIYHQLRPDDTELYDLRSDPKELRNLAADRPKEVSALVTELVRMRALSEIMPGATPDDRERAKKLKSLGYTH